MQSDAIFDKIEVRLGKINEEERKLQAIFKFVIKVNGEVKKTWSKCGGFYSWKCSYCGLISIVLDLKAIKLYVGDDANTQCTFIVEDEDMVNLGTGALTLQDAVAQNKLVIEGAMELALKLAPFVTSL